MTQTQEGSEDHRTAAVAQNKVKYQYATRNSYCGHLPNGPDLCSNISAVFDKPFVGFPYSLF
jgi:hypothetical protein